MDVEKIFEVLKNICLTIVLIGVILSIIVPLLVEITKASSIDKLIKNYKNVNSYIDNIWIMVLCIAAYLLSFGITGYLLYYIWLI